MCDSSDVAENIDPAFAAIDIHRKRRAEFLDVCELTDVVAAAIEGREITDAARAAWKFANDRADAALDALLAIQPQTKDGIVAVLKYFFNELDWATAGDTFRAGITSPNASPAQLGGDHG